MSSTPEDSDQSETNMLSLSDKALLERVSYMQYAGLSYGGNRDFYKTLGYDREIQSNQYRAKYKRGDIATQLIDLPASMCWRDAPTIVDDIDEGSDDEPQTQFEKDIQTLFDDYQLLHYLRRWDKAIGLGEYGLLMVGLAESTETEIEDIDSDTPSLDDRAEPDSYSMEDLAYFSVFTQGAVSGMDVVQNPLHERFGLPESYDLEMDAGRTSKTHTVHYTRVLHAAQNLLDNEIYGEPTLRNVFNRLQDREKILGGSAEAYWRSADRRLHLDYGGEGAPTDAEDVATEAEEMIHGLRGVLTTQNTDLNTIEGSDPNPEAANSAIMGAIAGATRIPKRILTGSERGELASTQDKANLTGHMEERRRSFNEPMMLRAVIDRLRDLGIVADPEGGSYTVNWDSLFELNQLEEAKLKGELATALKDSAPGGDPGQLATTEEIRESIMDWNPERGAEASEPSQEIEEEEIEENQPPDTIEDIDEMDDILDPVVTDGGE